ncbi:hypothetical protein HMPREF1051_0410 [Neisseria sicca VK64]|uniref:Uncharacterized protein n=1 Tax=Neisseria sicca VK64 TaxID=1095748 RepID=I2NIA5_NEISI|nr:hypothetical protein HMPREF1051_0410 [Neisseria sicca VK64]
MPATQHGFHQTNQKGRLKSDSNFKSGFRRPFVYCRLLACFR